MSSPARPGVWLPETVGRDAWGTLHFASFVYTNVTTASLDWDSEILYWCPLCWPDERCTVCGRPSGDLDQCGPCLHAATTLDKAIEARTSG